MLWRCERGHEWWATVNNRSTGTGCPFCAGHRVIAGMTDLATTHPYLAKEALGWDARLVSAGSHKRVWWRCKESHEWQALVSQRAKVSGSDCPFCRESESSGRLQRPRNVEPASSQSGRSGSESNNSDSGKQQES